MMHLRECLAEPQATEFRQMYSKISRTDLRILVFIVRVLGETLKLSGPILMMVSVRISSVFCSAGQTQCLRSPYPEVADMLTCSSSLFNSMKISWLQCQSFTTSWWDGGTPGTKTRISSATSATSEFHKLPVPGSKMAPNLCGLGTILSWLCWLLIWVHQSGVAMDLNAIYIIIFDIIWPPTSTFW